MRCQCFAVMIVGSPKAAAGTASATDALGAALDGHASAGDGGAFGAFGSPVAFGAFGAFAGVPIPPTGGALGDGNGDGGDDDDDDDDDDAAFALVSASLHFFDFFERATPSGGFGVTSFRHEERAAKTP
jgi:hypothetical protein